MAMRYIKIDYDGYIYPIRMNGPIVTPLAMDEKVAMEIVVKGYRCTEVDVKNNKEVKLTLDNFYKDDRFGTPSIKIRSVPKIETKSVEVTAKSNSNNIKLTEMSDEKGKTDENKEVVVTADIDTNNIDENKTYNFNKNKDKKNKNK